MHYFLFIGSWHLFYIGFQLIIALLIIALATVVALKGNSDNFRKSIQEKEQRTVIKNGVKRIKPDNLLRSNKENSNITIAILEK